MVSIHAFRGEGDWRASTALSRRALFQSTPSGGKATTRPRSSPSSDVVSIHAFRGEGDGSPLRLGVCPSGFQSTPSGGKATPARGAGAPARRFQSTPSGGKATRLRGSLATCLILFQSTPSGGKATCLTRNVKRDHLGFNPRLPGGRRRSKTYVLADRFRFNPRLPGGRRPRDRRISTIFTEFQSTPSGGKATPAIIGAAIKEPVSIHAFRGEGDYTHHAEASTDSQVSIHAFRGEGDARLSDTWRRYARFQSTPSGGKATVRHSVIVSQRHVSIHAFRGEGDRAQAQPQ